MHPKHLRGCPATRELWAEVQGCRFGQASKSCYWDTSHETLAGSIATSATFPEEKIKPKASLVSRTWPTSNSVKFHVWFPFFPFVFLLRFRLSKVGTSPSFILKWEAGTCWVLHEDSRLTVHVLLKVSLIKMKRIEVSTNNCHRWGGNIKIKELTSFAWKGKCRMLYSRKF